MGESVMEFLVKKKIFYFVSGHILSLWNLSGYGLGFYRWKIHFLCENI